MQSVARKIRNIRKISVAKPIYISTEMLKGLISIHSYFLPLVWGKSGELFGRSRVVEHGLFVKEAQWWNSRVNWNVSFALCLPRAAAIDAVDFVSRSFFAITSSDLRSVGNSIDDLIRRNRKPSFASVTESRGSLVSFAARCVSYLRRVAETLFKTLKLSTPLKRLLSRLKGGTINLNLVLLKPEIVIEFRWIWKLTRKELNVSGGLIVTLRDLKNID